MALGVGLMVGYQLGRGDRGDPASTGTDERRLAAIGAVQEALREITRFADRPSCSATEAANDHWLVDCRLRTGVEALFAYSAPERRVTGLDAVASALLDPTVPMQPAAGPLPVPSCRAAYGLAVAQAFFAALNDNDSEALAPLFVETGGEFGVTSFETLTTNNIAIVDAAESRATTREEVRTLTELLSGVRFSYMEPLQAGEYQDHLGRRYIGIGPLRLQASLLVQPDGYMKNVIVSGKLSVDCQTGLVNRVLLSPMLVY